MQIKTAYPSLAGERHDFLGTGFEGVIVKKYWKTELDPTGTSIVKTREFTAKKLVAPEFREITMPTESMWGPGITTRLGTNYAVPARFFKAYQHLKESGVALTGTPSDIALIASRLDVDLQEEEKDSIVKALVAHSRDGGMDRDALWEKHKNPILKKSRNGLSEWYKAEILPMVLQEQEKEKTQQ